ncbi:MAG: EFR1 family ferrodoxin [Clostridia bacterium]|nr:EFR1 family ferrodoxin [Clostridia bacterium]
MKGLICYFSTTGNTKLVAEAIAAKVNNVEWDLHDISLRKTPNLSEYGVFGLLTYTDFWGPPQKVQQFAEAIEKQKGTTPAFVLNTHAGESGKTLLILKDWVKSRGFHVVAGHSLVTPVNYPPALAAGWNNASDPGEEALDAFKSFTADLYSKLERLQNGAEVPEFQVKLSESDMALPYAVRTKAREEMGAPHCDKSLCSACGLCEKVCPYEAVSLSPDPVFDSSKCFGCWACFNLCPAKAIYTDSVQGKGHYEPVENFKRKLSL